MATSTSDEEARVRWMVIPERRENWTEMPMPLLRGMTDQILLEKFQRVSAIWRESEACDALFKKVGDCVRDGEAVIETCVFYASGSFSGGVYECGENLKPLYQLAVFITAVDAVKKTQGSRPTTFAQELYYNKFDKTLLSSLGITTVVHPAGFDLLRSDSNSLCHAHGDHLVQLAIIKARQALFLTGAPIKNPRNFAEMFRRLNSIHRRLTRQYQRRVCNTISFLHEYPDHVEGGKSQAMKDAVQFGKSYDEYKMVNFKPPEEYAEHAFSEALLYIHRPKQPQQKVLLLLLQAVKASFGKQIGFVAELFPTLSGPSEA